MNQYDKLKGMFAPLATPYDADENLDVESLQFNFDKYSNSALAGYLILGSNGENRSLTEEEKHRILKIADAQKGDKVLMAGCLYESLYQVRIFIESLEDYAVDFLLVQSPAYFKKLLTDAVLIDFFSATADLSPVPVLLYNAPGFNGVTLSPEVIGKLAAHPNIAGMKDSSKGDDAYKDLDSPAFKVLPGSITFTHKAVMRGAFGATVSMANYLPDKTAELHALATEAREAGGDAAAEAEALRDQLVDLNRKISGRFSIAGVKAAMDICGYRGSKPRAPYAELPDTQKMEIEGLLRDYL